MKFQLDRLVATLQYQLTKLVGGVLVLAIVWQSVFLGVTIANASPILATSNDSMSKQVSGTADEMGGSAKKAVGKTQSELEDQQRSATAALKENTDKAKNAIDTGAEKVENAAEQVADRVKGFFSK
jgi:uncharacterized protein YjbJ (UPF0337 family)